MIVENSFNKILNYAFTISKMTRGEKCTRAQKEGSEFLHKIALSGYSLFHIANPKPNYTFSALSNNALLYDFPSMFVIVRSMFEAYINMFYLLIDPKTDDEREFRLDRWEKHALTERQKIAKSLGSQHPILTEDLEEIKKYEQKIKNSIVYKNLSEPEKQSINNSEKWSNIKALKKAELARLHISQAEFIYKYLSNYTHSESYSLMQLNAVRTLDEIQNIIILPKRFGEMFVALTINCFGLLNDTARNVIEQSEELKLLIDFWESFKQKELSEMMKTANKN